MDACGAGVLELDHETGFDPIDIDGSGKAADHLTVDYEFVKCEDEVDSPLLVYSHILSLMENSKSVIDGGKNFINGDKTKRGECCPVTVTEKGDVNKGGRLHHRHHEEPPTSAAVGDLCRPASPDPSVVSPIFNGRVKRERDLSNEEVEAEKNSCRISDEDEDGPRG
ncbi:hypothetical protein V6N11_079703 [Hibiscus sabdariffa]|uniref:Barwin domain-containing protein n=1 Tax=Hibiscus sabdariffa TaxID=183260 RepID=A0ABR2RWA1_9ROSI